MKKWILYLGFLGLSVLAFFIPATNDEFLSFMILPYVWGGNLLRYLSLQNPGLNVLSFILYILLSLIPLILLGFLGLKKKAKRLDFIFLPLLSTSQFFILYYFINPHLLSNALHPSFLEFLPTGQLIQAQTLLLFGVASLGYLVALVYLSLKAFQAQGFKAKNIMIVLLDLAVFGFLLSISLLDLPTFQSAISSGITSIEEKTLGFLQLLGNLGQKGLTIYLFILLRDFVSELEDDLMDNHLVKRSESIYRTSFILILFSLIFQFIFILYQLIFLSRIQNVQLTLNIPILSLSIAIISFLLAKYFRKVNDLSEDHSLII